MKGGRELVGGRLRDYEMYHEMYHEMFAWCLERTVVRIVVAEGKMGMKETTFSFLFMKPVSRVKVTKSSSFGVLNDERSHRHHRLINKRHHVI